MNSDNEISLYTSQVIQKIENLIPIESSKKMGILSHSIITSEDDDIIQLRRQVLNLNLLYYKSFLFS